MTVAASTIPADEATGRSFLSASLVRSPSALIASMANFSSPFSMHLRTKSNAWFSRTSVLFLVHSHLSIYPRPVKGPGLAKAPTLYSSVSLRLTHMVLA